MDCSETRAGLANGEAPDASMTRHLVDCSDCQAYKADLDEVKRLLAVSEVTPGRLRADTLALSLDELAQSPAPVSAAPRRRIGFTPQAGVVLAILGTGILVGLSIWLADASGEFMTRFTVNSIFIQLVIQSFAAALLAPALLPLLRRLVFRPAAPLPVTGV